METTMTTTRGLSWDENERRGKNTALVAVIALIASLFMAGLAPAPAAADGSPSVWSAVGWEDSSVLTGVDFTEYPGSLYSIARSLNVDDAWNAGYSGLGIQVAVIDTGVAPVEGLLHSGKVINGPDLSFESQSPDLMYLDTYGHGTHLAGIIAGKASDVWSDYTHQSKDKFLGIAPDAEIVSIKVGSRDGAVDVSQVIAAIDWVVQHRHDPGLNIRVLNLAYGTLPRQSYEVDPLAQAVEKAWKAGIVVVVAAGNDGNTAPLRNPAFDPYVIAVGSAQYGVTNVSSNALVQYDRVSDFSNCGLGRTVDLVAPGRSITSLRVPGSYADDNYPQARVGSDYFLGSGTSQAAAVVSGAVAILLSRDGGLTPNEVKKLLKDNASPMAGVPTACQGAGVVDLVFVARGKKINVSGATQSFAPSNGSGLLELARGGEHVTMDEIALTGEQDIMGHPWIGFNEIVTHCWRVGKGRDSYTVCEDSLVATDTLWNGGEWNGTSWSGTSWSGTSWSGTSWSGTSWSGTSWSGTSWSGTSWSDKSWSGTSWSGTSWSGTSWSGTSWSGRSWSSHGWGTPTRGGSWR
jgi:serine protease AprX